MRKLTSLTIFALIVGVVALVRPSTVFAAAPPNDNFANATIITALPFNGLVNTTGATIEPGEPQNCNFMSQTVWYSFVPATNGVVKADTVGTGFVTELTVYQATGTGLSGLSFLGCSQNPNPVIITTQAGATYYIQAGILFGAAGDLHVNLAAVPPPPNDNFSNATAVGSLPFSDTVDTTAATFETGEPTPSCGNGPPAGSVWYSFKPATSESVSAIVNPYYIGEVGAYTGSAVASLTDLGCRSFGNVLTIHVTAGQTYYLQVGGTFGQRGLLTFNLALTPSPVAVFGFGPSDPSIFDPVQFSDVSSDPGGVGFQSEAWSFGDGTTTTGCCPTHRYRVDAGFTVTLTVTTFDGRTASASQVVNVKTHDIAISRFAVPEQARVGQTKSVIVGVSNSRYPETVQVQLFKSVPQLHGTFQLVGTLTQQVPAGPRKLTTPFAFSYPFTIDDAIVGKVTFEAVATIIGAREALPADNTAISTPATEVTQED